MSKYNFAAMSYLKRQTQFFCHRGHRERYCMAIPDFEKTKPKLAVGRKSEARNPKSEMRGFEKTKPISRALPGNPKC